MGIKKIIVKRPKDKVEVAILPFKEKNKFSFVNLTKGHICSREFDSYEEALDDMDKKKEEGLVLSYEYKKNKVKYLKEYTKTILTFCTIYIGLAFLWQLLEIIIYGKTTPSVLDSIICGFFTVSIYFNMAIPKALSNLQEEHERIKRNMNDLLDNEIKSVEVMKKAITRLQENNKHTD